MMPYSAMIVDDELLMRQYLAKNLHHISPRWIVACSAEDGVQAVELLSQMAVDLVITDIKMPDMDGLELAKYIRRMAPMTRIIIVSGFDEFDYAREALRCGVRDYLLKPLNDHKIAETINSIADELDMQSSSHTVEPPQLVESVPIASNTLVKAAVDYIHAHYNDTISLDILAEHLGISSNYLSEIFHKLIGQSYSKYLTHIRMERAVALMRARPDMRIYQISEKVGFISDKHFSTVFKRYYQRTPAEYMALLAAEDRKTET